MDKLLFEEMDRFEEIHWWFIGKRAIVIELMNKFIRRRKTSGKLKIADFGAGTGHMLKHLSEFGDVAGMEMSDEALRFAVAKCENVRKGNLPDNIPFNEKEFDFIVLSDVLEHIKDDVKSLKEVRRFISIGGSIIITVPAYMFLYSSRDRYHGHFRRYEKADIVKKLIDAGYNVEYVSYYNFILFPLAIIDRMVKKIFSAKIEKPDLFVPMWPFNAIFRAVFSLEGKVMARGGAFPWGLSIVAVATVK
ncbi:class I SAM-dependent methyltransferase [candidate division KSB1 bacterium]|nr:class I SAM-dependent methyltransferase [candidate division KSB1 bacterium]